MARRNNIDTILRNWDFDPNSLTVRTTTGSDGRPLIQMRIDMGLLQLETEGRPDGEQPEGFETYFDYLVSQTIQFGDEFVMDDDQCGEADREFVQFYHRRLCWLGLREYDFAVRDADHTLGLMDFCRQYSPDEDWTITHEQYRPFVLFHRTQAAALGELEDDRGGPEAAVQQINRGLELLRQLYLEHDAEDAFDEDELVLKLQEFRETLRDQFEVGRTLREQLADAIASEKYELAAQIRDELARRGENAR